MLSINLAKAQKLIDEGKDVSHWVILSQVRSLKREMRQLSTEMVSATLDGIMLQEQARLLLAYGKCLEDARTESERNLVIEVMSDEFEESCEEFVNILT